MPHPPDAVPAIFANAKEELRVFDWLFSSDLPLAVRFAAAFVVVLVIFMGGAALVHRLRNRGPKGAAGTRARQARLGVLDVLSIDSRRSLVIVRRDNVEHLIMIGGPNDVVVESAIVRHGGSIREAAPSVELGVRPDPRAAPPAMPAQPARVQAPQPAPQPVAQRPNRQEPVLAPAPRPQPPAAPQPPVPTPQPVQPVEQPPAPEPPRGRPAPAAAAPAAVPPAQGNAPELRVQAGPRAVQRPEAPREQKVRVEPRVEAPSAPPPAPPQPGSILRPLRPAIAPARAEAAPRPSEESVTPPHGDPLFGDIAQRLEQSLGSRPEKRTPPPPQAAKTPQPVQAAAKPAAAPAEAAAAPEPRVRSAFDSLEEEMASLLGRDPKRPD